MGLITGGATIGTLLWIFGQLVPPLDARLFGALSGVAFVALFGRELGLFPFELPQNQHQVPQESLHGSLAQAFFKFGFELGLGFRTYLSSSTPYLLAFSTVLFSPNLASAIALGAGFGMGRASMPLWRRLSQNGAYWDQVLLIRLHLIKPLALAAAFLTLGRIFFTNLI